MARLQPTAGLVEIEPSMAWNPSVLSGIGIVEDVRALYGDMHAYLAASGAGLHSSGLLWLVGGGSAAQAERLCSVWPHVAAQRNSLLDPLPRPCTHRTCATQAFTEH